MGQFFPMNTPGLEPLQRDVRLMDTKVRQLFSIVMNTRRHAFAAHAMERCRFSGIPPRAPVEFRAQFNEDCFLYELFEGKRSGFYIEAGAFNGVDFSVSYAFDQLGWNGLLVEALPDRAEECRQRRPTARVVHAALGGPGDGPTVSFTSAKDDYGGMLSRRQDAAVHGVTKDLPPIPGPTISVPVRTLDQSLEAHEGPIDFVVLDLEGAETSALSGFSLSKHRPRVLMIEDLQMGSNSAVFRAMASQPYEFACWIEMNAVFFHKDDHALRDRFEYMQVFGL